MRTLWRALPALLLGATLVAPATPAAAGWSCSYYRWDGPNQEWDEVARMTPRDDFRRDFVEGVDWHCEYCYVPAVPPRDPDDPFGGVADSVALVQELAEDTVRTVGRIRVPSPGPVGSAPVDPWNGPECPLVPPVWDADELDGIIGIG